LAAHTTTNKHIDWLLLVSPAPHTPYLALSPSITHSLSLSFLPSLPPSPIPQSSSPPFLSSCSMRSVTQLQSYSFVPPFPLVPGSCLSASPPSVLHPVLYPLFHCGDVHVEESVPSLYHIIYTSTQDTHKHNRYNFL